MGGGAGHVQLLLRRSSIHEHLAGSVVSHLQWRLAPRRGSGGRVAARLGPHVPHVWTDGASQWSSLHQPIHGSILFPDGGISRGPVVAGLLHLLFHRGWVGRRRSLRRQMDRTGLQRPTVRRQGVLDRAVRLPQGFLGPFAFQSASSPVLKPHLDGGEKNRLKSQQITFDPLIIFPAHGSPRRSREPAESAPAVGPLELIKRAGVIFNHADPVIVVSASQCRMHLKTEVSRDKRPVVTHSRQRAHVCHLTCIPEGEDKAANSHQI